jgi:hypothetical protein
VLAVPVVSDAGASVLVVSGGEAMEPEAWIAETIRAIGSRIQRFRADRVR